LLEVVVMLMQVRAPVCMLGPCKEELNPPPPITIVPVQNGRLTNDFQA